MDHLPQFSPSGPRMLVPYLPKEPYDNLDFFTYPNRRRYGDASKVDFGCASLDDVQEFLQNWLYFGFLNELLGVDGAEFIRFTENSQAVVTSVRLPHYLERWRAWELMQQAADEQAGGGKRRRLIRTLEVLRTVRLWLTRFTSGRPPESAHEQAGEARTMILEPSIATSIMVLGFCISRAIKDIWTLAMTEINTNFGESEYMLTRLLEAGWCPQDVFMVRKFLSVDCIYYLTSMKPLRAQGSHTGCSEYACIVDNIDEKTYQTRHVEDSCECGYFGPYEWETNKILENGGIPVICVDLERDEASPAWLKVTDYQLGNEVEYIAISHVWADGLGNTTRTTLPMCQLRRLQGFVNELCQLNQTDNEKKQSVPFWIDTLCVPVQRAYRNLAISRMRHTYRYAAKVLVLDAEILSGSRKLDYVNCCARIFMSRWQRRLWTLQEGVLAQDLYFQFRDGTLRLDDLREQQATAECFYEVVGPSLLAAAYYPINALNPSIASQDRQFVNICTAIQYRATSKSSDETICLATLLGIDPTPLVGLPKDQRMRFLINLIGNVPSGMIFLSPERHTEQGYRWLPRSILGNRQNSYYWPMQKFYTRSLREKVELAKVGSDGGLSFTGPGLRIHNFQDQRRDAQFIFRVRLPNSSVRAYRVKNMEGDMPPVIRPIENAMAIILDEPLAPVQKGAGVLVSLRRGEETTVLEADYLRRVWIYDMVPEESEFFEWEEGSYGGELSSDQKWILY